MPAEVVLAALQALLRAIAPLGLRGADAVALLRGNRALLDDRYLLHWIREKQIETEFAQVWYDAFPGEQNPNELP